MGGERLPGASLSYYVAENIELLRAVALGPTPQGRVWATFSGRRLQRTSHGRPLRLRPDRGLADGLLEGVQRQVLDRHPDWRARVHALEGAPVKMSAVGPQPFSRDRNWRKRERAAELRAGWARQSS